MLHQPQVFLKYYGMLMYWIGWLFGGKGLFEEARRQRLLITYHPPSPHLTINSPNIAGKCRRWHRKRASGTTGDGGGQGQAVP